VQIPSQYVLHNFSAFDCPLELVEQGNNPDSQAMGSRHD
jgi:hypothetical protein